MSYTSLILLAVVRHETNFSGIYVSQSHALDAAGIEPQINENIERVAVNNIANTTWKEGQWSYIDHRVSRTPSIERVILAHTLFHETSTFTSFVFFKVPAKNVLYLFAVFFSLFRFGHHSVVIRFPSELFDHPSGQFHLNPFV
jgi:hypothetical protein